MSYSQEGEEAFLLEHFKGRTGKFLDIGAADGIKFSNTRALAELGWSGVLVEPNPHQFVKLDALYLGNPKMTLVNAVVAPMERGLYTFYHSDQTVVASIDENLIKEWSKNFRYRTWLAASVRISDILLDCGYQYDFVSIDAEGLSVAIAREFLAAVYGAGRPEVMCVENDAHVGDLAGLGKYKVAVSNANNTILVRDP